MTLAKEAALDKAMAKRQTCPGPCGWRYSPCIPLKTLGSCLEGYDGTPADPASYITPPAKHLLAAWSERTPAHEHGHPRPFAEPDLPKNLLIRFIMVGGSYVDVSPAPASAPTRTDGTATAAETPPTGREKDFLFCIRPDANNHAATCRAIPLK